MAATETGACEDSELVTQLRAGDERAVETLVGCYAARVYRLAYRLTGTPEDAEEVTWAVMLTVSKKIASFRGDAALFSWIYRIATNAALETLRHRPRDTVALDDPLHAVGEGEPGDWSSLSLDPAIQSELRAVLEDAMARLPTEYRVAVVLRDVEGLSNVEVADLLGLSLPAAKSRVHRARLALRRQLAAYFGRTEARGPRPSATPSVARGSAPCDSGSP